MALIVQKYGGTSVATPDLICQIAKRIIKLKEQGNDLVIVVSAMGDQTDKLMKLAYQITDSPREREMDMLLSVGERITMALLSMAINNLGHEAISFTGSQSGIITDTHHMRARILEIRAFRITEELEKGKIVIVAGFQGVSLEKEVTTLGRGGSDTSAVALAAFLQAERCEILKDVNGVYTADPRIIPNAKKLDYITYDEMIELANAGAKVLHPRAVELAKKHHVPLHIRSSFNEEEGTLVGDWVKVETHPISGITHDCKIVKVTVQADSEEIDLPAHVFESLSKDGISIRLISQNSNEVDGIIKVSFAVAQANYPKTKANLQALEKHISGFKMTYHKNVAIVSLVGGGIPGHYGIAARMFRTLAEEKIPIDMISSSHISISCIIQEKDVERAVQKLYEEFGLEDMEIELEMDRIVGR